MAEVKMRGFDVKAQAGKVPAPDRRVDVLVIGAGAAGAAAAIEAARAGESVMLVDENPVSPGLMGLDTPLFFGGRYTGAVQTKARVLEQVFAANPLIEQAYEAGVEVELGVYCWGAWTPGYGLASLPQPIAGLADEERSWMVAFRRIILATGARDVALAFRGWDQPGVMGARALRSLIQTYNAFAGRRLVILGSGALALETARLALAAGLKIAALVEVEDAVQGPADLAEELRAAGVQILTGHVPILAVGGLDGVERLDVAPIGGGAALAIACDTVVQAISLTPAVELLDVLGARLAMQPRLGGHAPVSPDGRATSLENVTIAGDLAGGFAEASGRDLVAYQQTWMRALMAATPADVVICQCESVTFEALLGVRQPAYLGPPSEGMARRDLGRLLEDGPANQDQIKRLTRACMGPCQARRCREQVALALACASNQAASAIPLAGYRAPVRPLPLSVLAAWDEAREMTAHWDVWMGIPGQWTPYDDIGTDREALYDGLLGGDMHL
jgi:thioredoxin reductase